MSTTLIKVRKLTIGYEDRTLYSGVDFDINEGECIMLCGANGSGKTTLMKALEKSCHDGRCEAVMIPTRIPKLKGFTVKEFITIGCYKHTDLGGRLSNDDKISLESAMEALGLAALSDRDISTLSDGEFQKAGIAAALVRRASLIMLDEPTAFLDAENRRSVLDTLKTLCSMETYRTRPAVIFSTHDLHEGLKVADKVIALGADGKVHVSCSDNGLTTVSMEAAVASIFKNRCLEVE